MEYFFYIFFSLIITFSLCAVLLKNPVHSVLSLIVAFLNTAVIFIIFSAEFMAMVLVIVYVGAIAILFLFVVIMLNITDIYNKEEKSFKWVYGSIIGFVFTVIMVVLLLYIKDYHGNFSKQHLFLDLNIMAQALYVDYLIVFELAGIILLVSMVGSIYLTISKRKNIKRQNVYSQVSRSSNIELVKVVPYQGVNFND